jgi:hypothetical protein
MDFLAYTKSQKHCKEYISPDVYLMALWIICGHGCVIVPTGLHLYSSGTSLVLFATEISTETRKSSINNTNFSDYLYHNMEHQLGT